MTTFKLKTNENNYCLVKMNKIYEEIFEELTDEDLNMNIPSNESKIKLWLESKIKKVNYFVIKSPSVYNTDGPDNTVVGAIIDDILDNIPTDATNLEHLQGNTLIAFGDDNDVYEIFYMENLIDPDPDVNNFINEFGSVTNIHLEPVKWCCGIIKSSYSNGDIRMVNINISDVAKVFTNNFYHIGTMIKTDGSMCEITFTGENPYSVIGNDFQQYAHFNLGGFDILPFVQKSCEGILNEKASALMNQEIKTNVFFTLLCPTTNKKYWNITTETIGNIMDAMNDQDVWNNILKTVDPDDKYINPFYTLKKNICKK